MRDPFAFFEEAAILESHGIDVQSPGGHSNSDDVDGNDYSEQVSPGASWPKLVGLQTHRKALLPLENTVLFGFCDGERVRIQRSPTWICCLHNRTLGKYATGRRRDDVPREAEKQRR